MKERKISMDNNEFIKDLAKVFMSEKGSVCCVVSGSRTSLINDDKSDIDFYLYTEKEPDITKRNEMLSSLTKDYIIGMGHFGPGDEISKPYPVDIMYRDFS